MTFNKIFYKDMNYHIYHSSIIPTLENIKINKKQIDYFTQKLIVINQNKNSKDVLQTLFLILHQIDKLDQLTLYSRITNEIIYP